MKTNPELLSAPDQIETLARALRAHEVIAFDTEFIRENTFYPIVEILQIATHEESWLVDARAFKKDYRPGPRGSFHAGIQPLLDVLQDPKVLKIVHAAQGDQECLYTCFGITASPILDTAVAASLCGYGEGVGLGKLLKSVLGIVIKKGHARTNWSVRPLPSQLLEYAHADVEHLVALGSKLLEELGRADRKDWALELSAKWSDPGIYEPDLEATAFKLARGSHLDKKGYAALVELLRWREERVRQLNLPRRWVADDHVLIDLAHVRPKDLEHLGAFRGLNRGELKNSGETILAAIRRAGEKPEASPMPKMPRPDIPTPEEGQVLDLLKCYVGILADRHQVAAKHLLTSAQLLPLLRNKDSTPEDLAKAGILSPEAARLIGEDVIALVRGKRALWVDGAHIRDTER